MGAQAIGHVFSSRSGSLCRGGSESPQNWHWPTPIEKCVDSLKTLDRTSRN